jgi:hypothetical protein
MCIVKKIGKVLIFDSSSAHLVHESNSQVNYRLEPQTIHKLPYIIVSPNPIQFLTQQYDVYFQVVVVGIE